VSDFRRLLDWSYGILLMGLNAAGSFSNLECQIKHRVFDCSQPRKSCKLIFEQAGDGQRSLMNQLYLIISESTYSKSSERVMNPRKKMKTRTMRNKICRRNPTKKHCVISSYQISQMISRTNYQALTMTMVTMTRTKTKREWECERVN
jgi:hypothetical protein